MAKQFARVVDGIVAEIVGPLITPDGEEIPLEKAFPKWFVDECVDITNLKTKPDQRWLYDGATFSEPKANG